MCYGQTSYNSPNENMPSTLWQHNQGGGRAGEGRGVCGPSTPRGWGFRTTQWETWPPHQKPRDGRGMPSTQGPTTAGLSQQGPRSHSCRRVKNKGQGLFLGTLNSTPRIHFREGDSLKRPSLHETKQQRKALLWRARLTTAGPARSSAAPTPEEAHRAASESPQDWGTRNPLTNRRSVGQQPTSSLFIISL